MDKTIFTPLNSYKINLTGFTFQNLYHAYRDCRRHKSNTINAIRFERNLESNLLAIQRELENRTYRPSRSVCFVNTKPVPREIFAADFRDRVVHHLLIRKVEPPFHKKFIFHSFACQKNKGAHKAVKYLERGIRRLTHNFQKPAFYLKLDIAGFFMSIDQQILFNIFQQAIKTNFNKIEKEEILWLAQIIIFSEPTKNCSIKGEPSLFALIPPPKSLFHALKGKGLPIGNLTSQFFANVYLNKLDQFVKHKLKCKYYYRYVDDFILLARDTKTLKFWREKINEFLKTKLQLNLHPHKQIIQPINHGIDFVGYFVKPFHTLIRQRTVRNLKKRLGDFNKDLQKEKVLNSQKLNHILACLNSYYGFFRHSHSSKLRRHLYQHHFGRLQKYFYPANKTCDYFILNPKDQKRP